MRVKSMSLVSSTSAGGITFGHASSTMHSQISADGRWVVFESQSPGLTPGDTNGVGDVFLKDLSTGEITRLSVNTAGVQGNNLSHQPSISPDGTIVVFPSLATNFTAGDTNNAGDAFMKDLATGEVTLISATPGGGVGNARSITVFTHCISGDNRLVAFESAASNLVAGDGNGQRDVFVRDLEAGLTSVVSTSSTGVLGNGDSYHASLSVDGRLVVFSSTSSNLVAGDGNGERDIFVKNLETNETIRVNTSSAGVEANAETKYPSMSGNGRFVAFESLADNLVAGDANGLWDVFVKDLVTGETTLVSHALGGASSGNKESAKPTLSYDGRFVVFHSEATNLVAGDANGKTDVFALDRLTGETIIVSVRPDGVASNGASLRSGLSADGSVIIFESLATNLVSGDANAAKDVFAATVEWDPSVIEGGGGDDPLAGTPFADLISGAGGADTITADWGDDLVYGDGGADSLDGGVGDDTLDGGAGVDVMIGGDGDDTFYVDSAGDSVVEAADGGVDHLFSSIDVAAPAPANVEQLTLIGAAVVGAGNELANLIVGNDLANQLSGYALNDSIWGGLGNDRLNGGAGGDEMHGEDGNDTYLVDNVGDLTIETAGQGVDLVLSTISWTLGQEIENLSLTGNAATNGTGNDLANRIIGNAAGNALTGGGGADVLIGGLGADTLDGGAAGDRFVFRSVAESGLGAARDVILGITGLGAAGGDRIDLSAIDAVAGGPDNEAFAFLGIAGFDSVAGQLRVDTSGGDSVIQGDVDGDGIADFEILAVGASPSAWAAIDFIL